MTTENTDLVLFDLDGTLLEGDSELAWTEFLARKGLIDPTERLRSAQAFDQAYRSGELSQQTFLDYHLAPTRALKHLPRHELDALNREFQREVVSHMIRPGASTLVAHHYATGSLVALVTATNSFITGPIAHTLGFRHLIATVLDQDENGLFTGDCHGTPAFREGKVERVEHWLACRGTHRNAFRRRIFYSDSINDLSMFEWATDPIVLTPDEILAHMAHRRGWPVLPHIPVDIDAALRLQPSGSLSN